MAKIGKFREKKKMNTKSGFLVRVQEICTENGLFLKWEGPKTTISVLAVVEFCRVLANFPFLVENGAVFKRILG
jgi:hypothetical protein